jgi:hypothetical protein
MKSTTIFILIIPTSTMMYLAINTSLLNQVAESTMMELTNYKGLNNDDFNQNILRHFFDDEYDKNDHSKGRVFYSHSLMSYGTETERREKELIRQRFDDFGIISPKFYDVNREKMTEEMAKFYKADHLKRIEKMDFFKTIVSGCQMLVYSKYKNEITSGVAVEVNHAIDIGIPVFELVGNEFVPQNVHVEGLSYEETTEKYEQNSSSK